MAENVRVSEGGPMARITLHRPPLNVLTTSMLRDLATALDRVAADDDVRLVRLDAEGKVFSAGVDVGDHAGEALAPMMDAFVAVFEAFERVPVPTVAVVHGAALGGGCELTLATDLCLASDAASFGQPEIRLGVLAPPASVLLPRLVGERRAFDLLLSGETMPASSTASFRRTASRSRSMASSTVYCSSRAPRCDTPSTPCSWRATARQARRTASWCASTSTI
jgi:enoyl-CoA hydratase/carnithine racemase